MISKPSIAAQKIMELAKREQVARETMAPQLDFGDAIKALKRGKKLRRRGWNGKNQYIELAALINYRNPEGVIVMPVHDAIDNKAIAFIGTSGVQVGWLASQADMLAEDWEIVE